MLLVYDSEQQLQRRGPAGPAKVDDLRGCDWRAQALFWLQRWGGQPGRPWTGRFGSGTALLQGSRAAHAENAERRTVRSSLSQRSFPVRTNRRPRCLAQRS